MTTEHPYNLSETDFQRACDQWVREFLSPICASGLMDMLIRQSSLLEADGGLEWLEDAAQTERPCEHCDGNGHHDCDACESTGEIPCPECDGTGEDSTGEECIECEGACEVTCPDCEGDGRTDCPECDGEGVEQLGEIYEWWIVDDRGARRLREAGETVIDGSDLGLGAGVWGRRCTGQGMALDGVMRGIVAEFMTGEHSSWWARSNGYAPEDPEPPEDLDTFVKGAE